MTVKEILCMILAGGLGGLANVIFAKDGKFTFPRIFVDDNQHKHLIMGGFTEVFVGMVAGLTAIPLGLDDLGKLFYAAMLAGYGGGSVLDKRHKSLNDKRNEYINELEDE
jgi:hypothetical protein